MEFTKEFLGFWKGLTKFINDQGYWRMTKVVLFISFTICLFYLAKNFGETFDVNSVIQKEAIKEAITEANEQDKLIHNQRMKVREDIKPQITSILQESLHKLHADRAFVIELHNGSNNTAGLPFIHCTMTYEEVAKGIEPADEDYQNLTLSRFSFPQFLHENDFWSGLVKEGDSIDPKIAKKLISTDVNYIAITTIKSDECEIGYYGVVYCNEHVPYDKDEVIKTMISNVQHLSKLLDKQEEGNGEE